MTLSKKKDEVWVIPEEYMKPLGDDPKLVSGDPFNSRMIGAYFYSSLELSITVQPQYTNGRDVLCPMEPQLAEIFKPEFGDGKFGAVDDDEVQPQYQLDLNRSLFEIDSKDQAKEMARNLDGELFINWVKNNMRYFSAEGKSFKLEELQEIILSKRENNRLVQAEIEKIVAEHGYAPETDHSGKVHRKKYSDALLARIREVSSKKFSATGMNLLVSASGRHTIAKDNKYALSSAQAQTEFTGTRYHEKESFMVGKVDFKTIVIPIQSVDQLKKVIAYLKGSSLVPARWFEDPYCKKTRWGTSCFELDRVAKSTLSSGTPAPTQTGGKAP